MVDSNSGEQTTSWDKLKYAMDRWGMPVVALAAISFLFYQSIKSNDEFDRQVLYNQGQEIQLTAQMHEDHKSIMETQKQATSTQMQTNQLLTTANGLLTKINNEQHGRDK